MFNVATTSVLIISFATAIFATDYPIDIGKFHSFAHGLKSDSVQILDDKTIQINDFHYDGTGPDAFFVVGTDDKYAEERPGGRLPFDHKLPDENGSLEKAKGYNGKTFNLTLPGDLTMADIKYLALYCIRYNHNFGYVEIPSVNPSTPLPPVPKFEGPTKRNNSSAARAIASVAFLSLWAIPIMVITVLLR